jgi:hypothetical protein
LRSGSVERKNPGSPRPNRGRDHVGGTTGTAYPRGGLQESAFHRFHESTELLELGGISRVYRHMDALKRVGGGEGRPSRGYASLPPNLFKVIGVLRIDGVDHVGASKIFIPDAAKGIAHLSVPWESGEVIDQNTLVTTRKCTTVSPSLLALPG